MNKKIILVLAIGLILNCTKNPKESDPVSVGPIETGEFNCINNVDSLFQTLGKTLSANKADTGEEPIDPYSMEDTIILKIQDNNLIIQDIFAENCGFVFKGSCELKNDTIKVYEIWTGNYAYCICAFNIKTEIQDYQNYSTLIICRGYDKSEMCRYGNCTGPIVDSCATSTVIDLD
jgi:hypothetical protein